MMGIPGHTKQWADYLKAARNNRRDLMIDDLTIGELKKLTRLRLWSTGELKKLNRMFEGKAKSTLTADVIGKYVIVRSRNEGINAGIVEKADETGIVLRDARRIWYHRPADKSMAWYEGVAVSGLSNDSKVSTPVERKVIVENYSITVCTDEATKSITAHKSHEQS